MSQLNLIGPSWFRAFQRLRVVIHVCPNCGVRTDPGAYCSDWCEIIDAEWLHARLHHGAGNSFEAIGEALGITARQARKDYQSAMRKMKRGLRRLGVSGFDPSDIKGSMMAQCEDLGEAN